MFDSTIRMISMRRYAEGMLESATEVVRAQASEPRKGGERYRFAQMGVDIGCDDSLLPACEAAPQVRFNALDPAAETDQFMREHDAERLEVKLVVHHRHFK